MAVDRSIKTAVCACDGGARSALMARSVSGLHTSVNAEENERGEGVPARLGLGPEHESWMMMSGLVALCVLLAVALVVPPLFGARVAVITAVTAVLGILVICYIICVPRAFLRGTPATPACRHVHRGVH
jgi:hypothetical protein